LPERLSRAVIGIAGPRGVRRLAIGFFTEALAKAFAGLVLRERSGILIRFFFLRATMSVGSCAAHNLQGAVMAYKMVRADAGIKRGAGAVRQFAHLKVAATEAKPRRRNSGWRNTRNRREILRRERRSSG
jgi:hypothetical protein